MSSDSKYLAYVISDEGNHLCICVTWPATATYRSFISACQIQRPNIFSGGSYIYYTHTDPANGPRSQDYDLYRVAVLGGTPQQLLKDIDSSVSFSPDAQLLSLSGSNDPDPGKSFSH